MESYGLAVQRKRLSVELLLLVVASHCGLLLAQEPSKQGAALVNWIDDQIPQGDRASKNAGPANANNVEEIYILRSVRTSRIAPTDYCVQSRTSFAEFSFEDEYIFYAVTTAAQDGAVVNPTDNKAASLHACFGKNS